MRRTNLRCTAALLAGVSALLATLVAGLAATAPAGGKGLRSLLRLPSLHAEFALRLDVQLGFVLTGAGRNAAADIERLQRGLLGSSVDAGRHFELFELYRESGDVTHASNHLNQAVGLYRALVQEQSENAEVMARFGRALDLAGKEEEAEAVLRRAVAMAPDEWRAWSALGQALLDKSWSALIVGVSTQQIVTPDILLQAAAKRRLGSAQVDKAASSFDEAMRCAERALQLAPREPRAHSERALIQCYDGMFRIVREVLNGSEIDPIRFYQAMFSTNALASLERMAELAPEDPTVCAKVGLFQLMAAATSLGKSGMEHLSNGELWNLLAEGPRQRLRQLFTRLENLGRRDDPGIAAPALEFLGALQWMTMRDRTGAEKNLRRAVALDPRREAGWDFLMALLLDGERGEEAADVAEARLKVRDTPRNQVAAAKAFDRLGRLDKAQAHLERALLLDGGDYISNLAAAVVAMKRAESDEALRRAGAHLERAGRIEGHPASRAEWVEWTLTTGIYFGLIGEKDSARRELKRVLDVDPSNPVARDALAMIGN